MNRHVANYMWNFRPSETSPPPTSCIDNNRQFFAATNILSVADIEPLVARFHGLDKLWDRIPHWIIKADLGRLLYIYSYGNFYFDVDCRIRKKFTLDSDRYMVLFTEMILKDVNRLGPRECKNPENVLRVANYAFGTNVIGHPFLHEVILECIARLESLIESSPTQLHQHDILWVCGPDVITTVYHRSRHRHPDLILLDTTYLAHLCHGSWRE